MHARGRRSGTVRTLRTIAVLIAYVLPTVILPSVHAAAEALETASCVACADTPAPVEPQPAVRSACSAESPCTDPNHKHHSHPLHDPAHCTLCSSVHGLHRAPPATTNHSLGGDGRVVQKSSTRELACESHDRLIEIARGPPTSLVVS